MGFRLNRYFGKEPVQNLLVFRFANTVLEPFWNRDYVESLQITMLRALAWRAGGVSTKSLAQFVMSSRTTCSNWGDSLQWSRRLTPVHDYQPGTWGPAEAEKLLSRRPDTAVGKDGALQSKAAGA